MIKTKVAFLEGRLLSSQSEQSECKQTKFISGAVATDRKV